MARALTVALLVCLAWPTRAEAGPPREAKADPPPVGVISQAGTRRGGLEFGLAALLTGTSGALLGFGVSQYLQARAQAGFCAAGGGSSGIDPCTFDSPQLGYASAGLSWGFSALSLVGAGLLFARGARISPRNAKRARTQAEGRVRSVSTGVKTIHADARAYARLQLSVFGDVRSGGATVILRF
jgi:hypothetical protein